MKKYIFTILSVAVLMTTSCDDILDRPQLNTPTDGTFWKTEMDARLYANGFTGTILSVMPTGGLPTIPLCVVCLSLTI